MQRNRINDRKPRRADLGAAWISYSDMMAALLLVFVMVLVYSIYQYYIMLETKTAEIDSKTSMLIAQQDQLDEQTTKLSAQQILLDEQTALVDQQKTALQDKEEELGLAQISLQEQQDLLKLQSTTLEEQKSLLVSAQNELDANQIALVQAQADLQASQESLNVASAQLQSQQAKMAQQQQKLDDLVGVRSEIIQELSSAFAQQNLQAAVDPKTGDIMLESTVFFDTGSNKIKESGQDLLASFLPVYFSVLLNDRYKDYLGEIIIEGHTDTQGDYTMNLELSQKRALSVAQYCLELPNLSNSQLEYMRTILTAKGRSYSSPVLNADGTVNMQESRRVEFKFRLKDSEMIMEMNEILQQYQN